MSVCVLPDSDKQYRMIFLQQVCFRWFSCWHFYPQLSSTHTILVPFAAFGQNSIAEKRGAAAHISVYVREKLIWDEFSQIAGSFTTVGGSQVDLCMINAASLCPTCAFRRKCELTSSPYMLVTFTTVGRDKNTSCIISTDSFMHSCDRVFFFRAFVKCTFLCHSGIPADPLFHIL